MKQVQVDEIPKLRGTVKDAIPAGTADSRRKGFEDIQSGDLAKPHESPKSLKAFSGSIPDSTVSSNDKPFTMIPENVEEPWLNQVEDRHLLMYVDVWLKEVKSL